jgi:hypothetical protein
VIVSIVTRSFVLIRRPFRRRSCGELPIRWDIPSWMGGSTTGSLARPLLAELRPVRSSSGPDYGQADAIRGGVAIARGSMVAWLNFDDTYPDERVFRYRPDLATIHRGRSEADQLRMAPCR